jgi:cysteine desulfurase/selenocysteine lyase
MLDHFRELFPALRSGVAYLDSAAKSLTPLPVVEAITRYYRTCDANAHRGLHRLSREATDLAEQARGQVARLIGAAPEEIVFVRNTTEAIGLVAAGLSWQVGECVVSTLAEHHSNYLPWLRLTETKRVRLLAVRPGADGAIPLEEIHVACGTRPVRLVAVGHVSNALGTIQPVKDICRIARASGALTLVDAAQSAPHMDIDVADLGCDFLAFSGHKLFGPTGCGVLWGRRHLLAALEPLSPGGGTISDVGVSAYTLDRDPPYVALESGTQDIAGQIGLGEAVRCILAWTADGRMRAAMRRLVAEAAQELRCIPGVTVLGPEAADRRSATISFLIDGMSPHQAAAALDEDYGVLVRSGFHCAIPLLKHVLGLPAGTVRASFHLYSDRHDVDRLVEAVRAMAVQRAASAAAGGPGR